MVCLMSLFSFFGVLDDAKVREIEALEAETKDSNATIFFGHYPSSTVVSTGRRDVASIMSTGLAYLSGGRKTHGQTSSLFYDVSIGKGG